MSIDQSINRNPTIGEYKKEVEVIIKYVLVLLSNYPVILIRIILSARLLGSGDSFNHNGNWMEVKKVDV